MAGLQHQVCAFHLPSYILLNNSKKKNLNYVLQLNIYDLRYLKPPATTTADSKQQTSTPRTRPYLTLSTYRNRATPGYKCGFDIHVPGNLIAAASDPVYSVRGGQGRVGAIDSFQLFEATSGQELHVGLNSTDVQKPDCKKAPTPPAPSTCLQFIEREGRGLSLMAASPEGLHEWSWSQRREEVREGEE